MNKGSIVERLCSDLDRKEPQYKSTTLLLQWEIFHSCYEPFLSDSDIERILKIDQHLPKLQ